MLAVDTNVIIRYLTGDHPRQSAQVRKLIDDSDLFVGVTVILETEWVLRSVYERPGRQVATALRAFAGLPRVTIEEPSRVAQALDWMESGLDFADALHLARAGECEAFVSFDKSLASAASKVGAAKVRLP